MSETTEEIRAVGRPEPLGLFRVMCIAAGVWSAGAGVIHLLAVDEHRAHALMAALFLAAGSAGLAAGFSATTAAIAVPAGRQFVAGATMAVLVLLAPATLAEGRVHGHDSEASAHGHAESQGAGGHKHGSGGGHDHGSGSSHESFPQPELWGRKTTMRIGPFPLGAGERTGSLHVNRPGPVPQKPCTDCYITGFVPRLVYADGTTADVDTGAMLHHVVIMDTGRGDPTCDRWNGIGLFGQRIFASGNERTVFAYPRGFGYRPSNAPWGFVTELMNSSPEVKTVYVEIDTVYDVKEPADDVMGIMVLGIHETNDLSGGTPAPAWMTRNLDTKPPSGGHHH